MAVLNRTIARTRPKAAPTAGLHPGPVLLIAAAAIVIIGLLQVVQTSEATTKSFAIQRLEQDKLELEASVRELEADVAALSSLARIEQEARRLGLKPPEAREAVEVNVAWPGADAPLPTRFVPEGEEAGPAGEDSSWWQDLLRLLPFY